ncbi:efflux transporter outer membrane subunit [Pseudomonas sp. ABC1]|nr:efflux transporter outer membrane subunit [Pseudomonas sp. ABC1]QLF95003.1 efflux transporter outer membrane subunit [Pseudomonas sp. ABC1]
MPPVRRKLTLISIFVVSSIISGCISSSGIAPAERPLDAGHLLTDQAIERARQDAGWPAVRWWQAYGDPQLDTWVERALRGSPTLAEATARVRQAIALAGVAEAAESPQVDATTNLQRHHWPTDYFYGPGDLGNTTSWNNQAALGLSYALDFWGRERSASEQARASARMAVAEARAAQLELEGNIVRTYVTLALRHAELDIAQAMLAQQQEMLELAEKRLAGELGTELEVSQARVAIPETHRQIDALEESIALAHNQLAALVGLGPGAGATLRRPTLRLAGVSGLPSHLPAELLGRRPDVVASRWGIAAAAKGVDVAQADFYPNVDLLASASFNSVSGGLLEFFKGSKSNYSIGPAVSLPIFDGGRLRSRLGAVTADYDAAVARYERTLVGALKDISDQLIRLHSVEQQARFARQAEQAASDTYQIALETYAGGLSDYLDALQAQTRLFQQQFIRQQVEAARLMARADLALALGGGLEMATPAEAELTPERLAVKP